jgi:hypothetical protein
MSNPEQYSVGWICALETEYVAARAFLDIKHDRPETLSPNENNHYTLGEIGGHHPITSTVKGGAIALGCRSGRVYFIKHTYYEWDCL